MINRELAQLMYKLSRSKGNWGAKPDRLEHYKRFQNLKEIVKEGEKRKWVLIQKKPNYKNISLNSKYKKEIREFILSQLDYFIK